MCEQIYIQGVVNTMEIFLSGMNDAQRTGILRGISFTLLECIKMMNVNCSYKRLLENEGILGEIYLCVAFGESQFDRFDFLSLLYAISFVDFFILKKEIPKKAESIKRLIGTINSRLIEEKRFLDLCCLILQTFPKEVLENDEEISKCIGCAFQSLNNFHSEMVAKKVEVPEAKGRISLLLIVSSCQSDKYFHEFTAMIINFLSDFLNFLKISDKTIDWICFLLEVFTEKMIEKGNDEISKDILIKFLNIFPPKILMSEREWKKITEVMVLNTNFLEIFSLSIRNCSKYQIY